MTEQFTPPEPEHDLLRDEAHGDEDLYGLLLAKEVVGQDFREGVIDETQKREGFAYLNQRIAQRRTELGLDPFTE